MAYSAGFSPHPKISYANAAPTGAASEAEYVEIGVTRPVEPEVVKDDLDRELPPGLDIVDVVAGTTPDWVGRLEASRWRIEFPGVTSEELRAAVEAFMAADLVEVERRTKSGMRRFDAREPCLGIVSVDSDPDCAILEVVVRHVTPSVRPDDLITALATVADVRPPIPPVVTRLAQGPLVQPVQPGEAGLPKIGDPLDPDR